MSKRKYGSNMLTLATDPCQFGKICRVIFKQFKVHCSTERMLIHKWKTYETAASLPSKPVFIKSIQKSICVMLKEMTTNEKEKQKAVTEKPIRFKTVQ
ncbi:hypothetical protein AMECASPLE_031596 [Ameca splendens]|uniref:Uncharacterized protein n=1 Tax=Ameca splendens TaxID=208324 RepID=A0ABV0ZTB5_9TELE